MEMQSPLLNLGDGGRSMIDINDQWSTFTFAWKGDCLCWSWGINKNNTERINSQLSLSYGKVITSVDPGGGGVDRWSTWRGSTVTFHFYMERWLPFHANTHTLCPEHWDLCVPELFHVEHGMANSGLKYYRCSKSSDTSYSKNLAKGFGSPSFETLANRFRCGFKLIRCFHIAALQMGFKQILSSFCFKYLGILTDLEFVSGSLSK